VRFGRGGAAPGAPRAGSFTGRRCGSGGSLFRLGRRAAQPGRSGARGDL